MSATLALPRRFDFGLAMDLEWDLRTTLCVTHWVALSLGHLLAHRAGVQVLVHVRHGRYTQGGMVCSGLMKPLYVYMIWKEKTSSPNLCYRCGCFSFARLRLRILESLSTWETPPPSRRAGHNMPRTRAPEPYLPRYQRSDSYIRLD